MRLSRMYSILKNLNKLNFQIRSPHQQIASQKALTYLEKDDEGRDIFELYKTEDKRHIDSLFESLRKLRIPKDGPGELLKARLAASITARRRQFRYWERHEKKLARDLGDAANRQSAGDHALQDNKPLVGPQQASTVLSATVVSDRIAATALNESMETATVVTTASTARDLQGRTAEFPGPPLSAQDGDFVCPYCKVLCPHKYSIGKAWR